MTELEQLIAEQARDDSSFQPPEQRVVPLDRFMHVLSNEGIPATPRNHRRHPECHLHGRQNIAAADNWVGWRCRICFSERAAMYLKTHPEKRALYKRRWYHKNLEKAREINRRSREKHRDEINRRRRETRKEVVDSRVATDHQVSAGAGGGASPPRNPSRAVA